MPKKKAILENQNTDCPWSEKSCFKDFLCLLCVYAWHIERKEFDVADEIYVTWEPMFLANEIERVGGASKKILIERIKDANNPLPSKSQLAILEMLSKKAGVPAPKVATAAEAKEIINALKKR